MFKQILPISWVLAIGLFCGYANADSCVTCDSSKEALCAQSPNSILSKNCQTTTNGCYTRIVDGGVTLRGCTGEMDKDVVDKCHSDVKNCDVCQNLNDNVGCNNKVFPDYRLHCHTCDENLGGNCSNAISTNPVPCKTYQTDDQCYIRKTAKAIKRGCLSDADAKCNNQAHCYICKGNGCNSINSSDKAVPVAPSSAVAWRSTMPFVVLLLAFIINKL